MTWSVQAHTEPPLIEMSFSGETPPKELQSAFEEGLRLHRSLGYRLVLTDCSQLTGGHSVTDLYVLAELYSSTPGAKSIREAVILPPVSSGEFLETVGFWETVNSNRGMNVRVFRSRAEAEEWLLRK